MVKAASFFEAFSGGELSPRMDARVSFKKYPAAMSRGHNLVSLPQGATTVRPGSRYITTAQSASYASTLYGFQPRTGASYVLEFGQSILRFYKNQGQLTAANITATVANGDFTGGGTPPASWDDHSTGSASITTSSNRMSLVGAGDGWSWCEQDISITETTTEHVFRFYVRDATTYGETCTVRIGTTSKGNELWDESDYGRGYHTIAITPNAATVYFQVIYKGTGNFYLDNVEILDNVAVQLTSPYTAARAADLRIAQSNDVLYLFHPDVAPHKIERRGDKSWSIIEVFWEDGPWLGINPDVDLDKANLIANPFFEGGVQEWDDYVTASGNIEYDGASGVVFFKSSSTAADAELRQAVVTTSPYSTHILHFQIVGGGKLEFGIGNAAGGAQIEAFAQYKPGWYTIEFTPTRVTATNAVVALTNSTFHITFKRILTGSSETYVPGVGGVLCYTDRNNLVYASGKTGSVTVAPLGDSDEFVSTDVGRPIRLEHPGREPGWGIITAVAVPTITITGITQANPAVVTSAAHALKNGKRITISGVSGMTEVNGNVYTVSAATTNTFELLAINSTGYTLYTSGGSVAVAARATVRVYRKFQSTGPVEVWRFGSWSDTSGFPGTGFFYQQRLFTGNSATQPQTCWASQSNDFENMRPDSIVEGSTTTEDDDALDFTFASKQVAPILWFAGTRRLLVGTATGHWAITSRGPVLTPTDFNAEPQTSVAIANVAPIQIDNVALFVDAAQKAVYDIGFDYEIDGFKTADITILADHIAGTSTIDQIVYQQSPHSIIWVRKSNGSLACLTYKRTQKVVGWTSSSNSSGPPSWVESIAVIPGAAKAGSQVYASDERFEVWLSIKRTVNSVTVRHISVMEGFYKGPNRADYETLSGWQTAQLAAQDDAFYVDAGVTETTWASPGVIAGLDHLEGETVAVWADGVLLGDYVVGETLTGKVSLGAARPTKAHAGIGIDWVWRSLKLPHGARQGSSVGQTKTVTEMTFVLLDSGTFQYGIDADDGVGLTWYTADQDLKSDGTLLTGEVSIEHTSGGYGTDPRLWLKGSGPTPFTMLGLLVHIQTNEK